MKQIGKSEEPGPFRPTTPEDWKLLTADLNDEVYDFVPTPREKLERTAKALSAALAKAESAVARGKSTAGDAWFKYVEPVANRKANVEVGAGDSDPEEVGIAWLLAVEREAVERGVTVVKRPRRRSSAFPRLPILEDPGDVARAQLFEFFQDEYFDVERDRENPFARNLIEEGYFAPRSMIGHDELLATLLRLREAADVSVLRTRWIFGLATRRLEYLPAYTSWLLSRHFRQHEYSPEPTMRKYSRILRCTVCGMGNENVCNEDKYAQYAFLFGGGFVLFPSSMSYHLRDHVYIRDVPLLEEHVTFVRSLLGQLASLSSSSTFEQAVSLISNFLAIDAWAAHNIGEMFGAVGILKPSQIVAPIDEFHTPTEILDLSKNKTAKFPVFAWSGRDGVDWSIVKQWFPELASGAD